MDFTTNYCGMYWSDGTIQSSVVGSKKPVSELDAACMRHDSAYALSSDTGNRIDADNKFYSETNKLGFRGKVYGNLVKHGNNVLREAEMAFVLPFMGLVGSSLATTFGFSKMLHRNGTNLRSNDTLGSDGGIVYGPSVPPTPGLRGYPDAPGDPSIEGAQSQETGGSALGGLMGAIARDPGLMQNLNDPRVKQHQPTKLYKPLTTKKQKYTPKEKQKLKEIHLKHNPPVNKTKTDTKHKKSWFSKNNAVHVSVHH